MRPRTKLSSIATGVLEAGWIAALLFVPVFFNIYTQTIFEPDKALLLRTLATLMAAALLVAAVENRSLPTIAGRPLWRHPIGAAVLALTAIYGLATLFGIDPYTSLWGGYERNHGFVTWLGLVVVFFAGAAGSESTSRVKWAIDALTAAAVAVAAYGIAQALGLDPVQWRHQMAIVRPASTAGNPIFAAAFLAVVLPLTLARALERTETKGPAAALPFAVAVVLQGVAIALSQSRGPTLALLGGLIVLGLLLIRLRLRRALRAAIAISAITVAIATFALPRGAGTEPMVEQRATRPSTVATRVIIWTAVAELVQSTPSRLALGHGPENLFVAFAPFYPAILGQYEHRNVSPDRSHNQTLDALSMTGIAGCVAELALFGVVFAFLLRRLSLLGRVTSGRLALFAATGASIGVFAPLLLDGSLRFAGIGVPIGFVAGMLAPLMAAGWRDPAAPSSDTAGLMLAAGIFSSVLIHLAEIQIAIAMISTRLVFMTCAAMALVTANDTAPSDQAPAPYRPDTSVLLGTAVAGLWIVLTFDLYTPTSSLAAASLGYTVTFAPVWLLGALAVLISSQPKKARGFSLYAASSIGLWLAFWAVYKPWIDWTPPSGSDVVAGVGSQLHGATAIVYVAIAAWVAFYALLSTPRSGPKPAGKSIHPAALLTLPSAAAAVFLAFSAGLLSSHADVFTKLGGILERKSDYEAAVRAHESAYEMRSEEGRYAVNLGQALIRQVGESPAGVEKSNPSELERAERVLQRAARAHPADPDYPVNLARLYRFWGARAPIDRSAELFERAEVSYRATLRLRPQAVMVWNELATLLFQLGRRDEAEAVFAHSLDLDPRNSNTYWTRAEIAYGLGDFTSALRDYSAATEVRPSYFDAWSGLSATLAKLGRFEESITAAQRALEIDPHSSMTHRNLARLYRASDDPTAALNHARKALDYAEPRDRAGSARLLQELETAAEKAP